MPLIEVDNVSKVFHPRRGPGRLVSRGGLTGLFRRGQRDLVSALQDISLTVDEGEAIGIIGANGSGKSTLLKLLAGVSVPTTGSITVRGRVASLLELGAGFHPLLTGRENIYLNARILGLNRAQVDAVLDQIVAFSGIGEFLDTPVNVYSSGMFVRLGFAVAVHTDPDIFLVDEVLSVGDEEFQRRCRVRIGELREQGKTIVFVSHDLGIVNTLCNRVVLLAKGKMISRGTPQATIDFYLRQVGREAGIHTLASGKVEAIFCHGRISLFHDKKEVSAPSGLVMSLYSMGQCHHSTDADWDVIESGPDYCVARGRLRRLPATLVWNLRIAGDRLTWQIALECQRDTSISQTDVHVMWPTVYTNWTYGDLTGPFPEIRPGDFNWAALVSVDVNCTEAAALPMPGSDAPPALIVLEQRQPFFFLTWHNSDYVMGVRALRAGGRVPDHEATLSVGRHELMTLSIDLGLTEDQVSKRAQARQCERALISGGLMARFESGRVRLTYDGEELSSFLHFYTSLLIGNLWNDSFHLQWGMPQREGNTLRIRGESRRFAFSQCWQIEAVEAGVAFRIELDVAQPLDVQEYQASVVLRSEYSHWETPHEAGPYPDFDAGQADWRHANRDYATGDYAKAFSPLLPSVMLKTTASGTPFRMTAINTGCQEKARVLQALRTPEAGFLHFEEGTHLYFAGVISVDPKEHPPATQGDTQ